MHFNRDRTEGPHKQGAAGFCPWWSMVLMIDYAKQGSHFDKGETQARMRP